MPRIFHLIKSLGRGGAEVLLSEGLRHANRQLFEFGYGYFLPERRAMVADLEAQGAEVVCFQAHNRMRILSSARRVSAFLRDWKADLLHCHLPLAGVVGRIAGRTCNIPVIYTEHNRLERYHPATRMVNVLTWRLQERVIAVSAEVAASIESHIRHSVPIRVVLNGVDLRRFSGEGADGLELRRSLGIPPDAPVVGTVAVFRAQKALNVWLQAAQRIRERCPDSQFLLVGDGPLRDELRDYARSLGLSDVVHFTGLKEDVRPHLDTMDVFLQSSLFEGLPVAVLEAMAMRRAVVATAVGGVPEVISHGTNGYLVGPGDPNALADSVLNLLASKERIRSFGVMARQTIERGFSVQRMTDEIEAIYLDVLRDSKNGG